MTKIFGFSEATYIALHSMGLIAEKNGDRLSIREMAKKTWRFRAHLARLS